MLKYSTPFKLAAALLVMFTYTGAQPVTALLSAANTRSKIEKPVVFNKYSWRTCTDIPVLLGAVNLDTFKISLVRESLDTINELTGLSFTIVGRTDEIPSLDWPHSQTRSGNYAYPPIYIGWLTPSDTSILDKDALGATIANPATVNKVKRIVTGAVVFNENMYDSVSSKEGSGESRRNLIMHELAHLAGLEHSDGKSLMNSQSANWTNGLTKQEENALKSISLSCK